MRLVVPIVDEQHRDHVVFYDTDWEFYEAVSRQLSDVPTRVNFDGSTLEIMTLSIEHEELKHLIGRIIGEIASEFEVDIRSGGSATLKLSTRKKGLEADECFWVQHGPQMRGVARLDLSIHPPPDLVVEVDVTHAVVDREAVYASIGVPEMWHYDKQTLLTGWQLVDGNWSRIENSVAFPAIHISDLNLFIQALPTRGETAIIKEVRTWLRTLPR
jgi:Uma2 family endonuclease